jgi:hypothetical protein
MRQSTNRRKGKTQCANLVPNRIGTGVIDLAIGSVDVLGRLRRTDNRLW